MNNKKLYFSCRNGYCEHTEHKTFGDGVPLFSQKHPQRTSLLKRIWHGIGMFLGILPRFSKGVLTGEFTSVHRFCPYGNDDCPKCNNK